MERYENHEQLLLGIGQGSQRGLLCVLSHTYLSSVRLSVHLAHVVHWCSIKSQSHAGHTRAHVGECEIMMSTSGGNVFVCICECYITIILWICSTSGCIFETYHKNWHINTNEFIETSVRYTFEEDNASVMWWPCNEWTVRKTLNSSSDGINTKWHVN